MFLCCGLWLFVIVCFEEDVLFCEESCFKVFGCDKLVQLMVGMVLFLIQFLFCCLDILLLWELDDDLLGLLLEDSELC